MLTFDTFKCRPNNRTADGGHKTRVRRGLFEQKWAHKHTHTHMHSEKKPCDTTVAKFTWSMETVPVPATTGFSLV